MEFYMKRLEAILNRLDAINDELVDLQDMNRLNGLRSERKDLFRELADVKLVLDSHKLVVDMKPKRKPAKKPVQKSSIVSNTSDNNG